MLRLSPPCRGQWICWVLAAATLVGCQRNQSDGESPVPADPYSGVEVRFLIPAGLSLAETWLPALNDWADESQGTFDLIEFDFSTISEDRLAQELTAEEPILVLLPSPFLNSLVAKRLVATIPESVLDDDLIEWSSVPAPARRALGLLGDRPAIVPVTCEVPICCYRADLLEAAGKQIPVTWNEYDALAASLPQWADGLSAVEPWAEPYRTTTFYSRAISAAKHPAQFSVELNVASGDPLIASAPFLRVLEEVAAIRPHLATTVETLSPRDCLRELREGRAAMGIVWDPISVGTPSANDQSKRSAVGDLQAPTDVPLVFAPLPGREEVYDRETDRWQPPPVEDQNRPALCGRGGFSVCVLSTASDDQQAAAWDLWGLLEAYQLDGTILRLPGNAVIGPGPGASSQAEVQSLDRRQPSRQAVTASLQNSSLACELPVYGQFPLRSALSEVLESALTEDRTPTAALEDVAERWSAEIDELGRSQVLNSYRQRLGLSSLLE